jgi:hypothetical protein
MDLFLEGCQGLGLALAMGAIGGTLAGASAADRPLNIAISTGAAAGGALLFGWSLTQADHPAWPGWPVGALLALFALATITGVVAGARERAGEEGSASALAAPILLAALALAGLSLVFGPVALVALAALVYLAVARRRRDQRKYEGLRVLR